MRRWFPFLLIFLMAAVLRLIALAEAPPGLQHDEVFHGHDAVTVLLGYHPLYFTSNAGNEPLFIYLMALTIGLFGPNEWGVRLAAVLCGLLTLLFTYLWIRRTYNPRTALIAAALLAVNFWPLFLSRVGLRAASVPMMASLTAWLLFRISDFGTRNETNAPPNFASPHPKGRWRRGRFAVPRGCFAIRLPGSAVLAGVALGLSLYTYPAARTLPIVYVLFFAVYSLLTRKLNRSLLITLVTALVVFAPLGYTIAALPQADVRLQQLSGPVQELIIGNVGPVLRYARDTLGMFNFAGDPIARYNLPGRPVFDAMTGILFLLGIGLALRKWREPRNLFALLWLPIGLLPSMFSDSAPSFLRASAALPVTFLFPALAIDWLLTRASHPAQRATQPQAETWREQTLSEASAEPKWESKDARRYARPIGYALTIGLIVFTGASTVRDYFVVWPNRSDVREVYRSDLAAAAQWIEQQPPEQPIVVASTNPRDLDPFLFDFQLQGKHDVKWIDRAFAVVFPDRPARLISPAYSPIDPKLRDRFLDQPSFVSQFEDGSPAFEVYELAPLTWPLTSSLVTTATTDRAGELSAPINVNHALEFLGYEAPSSARPGEVVPLALYWRVKQDVDAQQLPLSLFAHLLNEHSEFAAGRDLLAFPTAGWRAGDVWIQQNDVPLPADLQPGKYRLEIGVYSQADGSRWRMYDTHGNDAGDRLLLKEVDVVP